MDELDWVLIPGVGGQPIGAVGFVGDQAAVVVAFFDDIDGNKDGTVDWAEWLASKISPLHLNGSAVVEVAMAARLMAEVITRDGGFYQWAGETFTQFAGGLVIDAAYVAYFSLAVRALSGGVAGAIGGGLVREYVIRRGMEAAIHRCYDAGVRSGVEISPIR